MAAGNLGARDLAAVLDFAERSLAVHDFGQVPTELLGGLTDLVGCETAKITHLDLRNRRELAVYCPQSLPSMSDLADYYAVGRMHPLKEPLTRQMAAPAAQRTPLRISDVLPARRWQATVLHATTHRQIGDQMGLLLGARDSVVHVAVLSRHGDRTFTDRQRDVLASCRAHLATAVYRAQRQSHHLALEVAPQVRWVSAQEIPGLPETRRTAPQALSKREQEVLALVATGRTDVQIARALGLSPATVSKHLQRVYKRLNLPNRAAAALYWSNGPA